MIPAKAFSVSEFKRRFPFKGPIDARADFEGPNNTLSHESIMNDVPPGATSCRVYSYNDLEKYRPIPPIYSIPEEFQKCRQLKSLQAVFKTIPGAPNTCIFSHMLVSPEDVEATLSEKVFQDMREVQAAVSCLLCHSVTD